MKKIFFCLLLLLANVVKAEEDEVSLYVLDPQKQTLYRAEHDLQANSWVPVYVNTVDNKENLKKEALNSISDSSLKDVKLVGRNFSPMFKEKKYFASLDSSKIVETSNFEDIFQAYVCKVYDDCTHLTGTIIHVDNVQDFFAERPYTLLSKTQAVNGKKNGLAEMYYPDGKLEETCYFENGVENGPIVQYYPNGNYKWKGNYQNGKLNGLDQVFHEDGQLSISATYVDNMLKGPFKVYGEDGYVQVVGEYVGEGNLVRNFILYSKDGQIVNQRDEVLFKIQY